MNYNMTGAAVQGVYKKEQVAEEKVLTLLNQLRS